MRKITILSCSLGVGLIPAVASPIGLGHIRLMSSLNQSFDAEIRIIDLGNTPLNEVNASLASGEEFNQVGAERQGYLGEFKFEITRDPNNKAVVRITTKDPINEPVVSFLMDLNSPDGKLLRQYTVFLDPPDYAKMPVMVAAPIKPKVIRQEIKAVPPRPFAVNSASTLPEPEIADAPDITPQRVAAEHTQSHTVTMQVESAVPAVTAEPQPEFLPTARVAKIEPQVEIVPDADVVTTMPGPATPDVVEPVLTKPAVGVQTESRPDVYGPTNSHDTLWNLASKMRSSSVTVRQAMVAIYKKNPKAFVSNNMNGLKSGYELKIPTEEEMKDVSNVDAIDIVNQQQEDWIHRNDPVLTAGGEPVVVSPETEKSVIVAEPMQALVRPEGIDIESVEVQDKEAVTGQPKQVIEDSMGEMVEDSSEKPAMQLLPDPLADDVLQTKPEIINLQPTETSIEEQLANISDSDDAQALQAKLALTTETIKSTRETNQALKLRIAELEQMQQQMYENLAKRDQELVSLERLLAKQQSGLVSGDNVQAIVDKQAPGQDITLASSVDSLPERNGGSMRIISGAIFFIAMITLGGFYWQSRRQRKLAEEAEFFADVIDHDTPESELDEELDFPQPDAPQVKSTASTPEMPVEQGPKLDIHEEAKVLIAYGRFQQAETLLAAAVPDEVKTIELNINLLEAYAKEKSASDFERVLSQLPENLQAQYPEQWGKVVALKQNYFPEVEEVPEVPEVPDVPEVPEVPEVPDVPEVPEVPKVPKEPSEPTVSETKSAASKSSAHHVDFDINVDDEKQANKVDDIDIDHSDNALDFESSAEDSVAQDKSNPDLQIKEMATKLDLARVYVEMGDHNEAKALLEEVLDKGNEEQRNAAQELLNRSE